MRIKKLISGILSAAMCLSIMGGATASAELSEDKTLYSWRSDVNADNVWGGGLAKNGGIRQHTMSNSIKPNRQYALIKRDMSISALIWAKRLQKVRST